MKHLIDIDDLDRGGIEEIHRLADHMVQVGKRPIPKLPTLRGRTVVSLFYEDSTRTRLSFETAARRLGADTMGFAVSSSSVKKGESLRDTVETIAAMRVDAFVVRHASAGVPLMISRWTDASVINAGDGWHAHPTQALLDTYTLRNRFGSLDGLRIAIVGDIKHSRVARSTAMAMVRLGAEVTLVAPPTLMPPSVEDWGVSTSFDLDAVLDGLDACYLLRIQTERMGESLIPSQREYTSRWGLTEERFARLGPEAVVMHPGPMNRGIEIASDVADSPRSLITQQVSNGIAVRMAVLLRLLGSIEGLPEQPPEADPTPDPIESRHRAPQGADPS